MTPGGSSRAPGDRVTSSGGLSGAGSAPFASSALSQCPRCRWRRSVSEMRARRRSSGWLRPRPAVGYFAGPARRDRRRTCLRVSKSSGTHDWRRSSRRASSATAPSADARPRLEQIDWRGTALRHPAPRQVSGARSVATRFAAPRRSASEYLAERELLRRNLWHHPESVREVCATVNDAPGGGPRRASGRALRRRWHGSSIRWTLACANSSVKLVRDRVRMVCASFLVEQLALRHAG